MSLHRYFLISKISMIIFIAELHISLLFCALYIYTVKSKFNKHLKNLVKCNLFDVSY